MNIIKKLAVIKKILSVIDNIKISSNGDIYIKTTGSVVLDTTGHLLVGAKGNVILSPERKIYLAPSDVRETLNGFGGADVSTLLKDSVNDAVMAESRASEALFSKACNTLHENNKEGCCNG